VHRHLRLALYLLTTAGVVFRSELALLVGTTTLYLLLTTRLSIPRVILPAGLGGLLIGLLCTIPLDSFFWQTLPSPLWPEWIAFYYNTVQGHSADWGVSAWHFYFGNALPRLLLNPVTYTLCIPLAVLNSATRRASLTLLIPLLSFVVLYSLLPHKEWRFIIYTVPGLTGVAGSGAAWIWTRRGKSAIYALFSLLLVLSVLVSFLASATLLTISSLNYPGAAAMRALHTTIPPHTQNTNINVYADNLACQTGVTRFLELHGSGTNTNTFSLPQQNSFSNTLLADGDKREGKQGTWTYDKTEDPVLLHDPLFWAKFDYVLAERVEKVIGRWEVVRVVYGYGGVRVVRPGEESGGGSRGVDGKVAGEMMGFADSEKGDWTDRVATAWKGLEGLVRERVLRGWWVEVRMEPRIRILRNLM
jgi:alpha-1,6-mannosyltransferase